MSSTPPDETAASVGSAPEAPGAPERSEAVRRCRCGFSRDHYMVSADLKYSFWGWFWLTLVGASANPIRGAWRCRVCGETIGETDDPDELRKLRDSS